jgi:hypothetical protein
MHRVPDAVLCHSFRHDRVQPDDAKFEPTKVLIGVCKCGLFFFNELARPLVCSGADHLCNIHQAIDQKATKMHAQDLGPVTCPLLAVVVHTLVHLGTVLLGLLSVMQHR